MAEFLRRRSLASLGILYQPTCVRFGTVVDAWSPAGADFEAPVPVCLWRLGAPGGAPAVADLGPRPSLGAPPHTHLFRTVAPCPPPGLRGAPGSRFGGVPWYTHGVAAAVPRAERAAPRQWSGTAVPPPGGWGAKARGHYPQLELLLNRVAPSRTTGHGGWATGGAGGRAPNPNPAGAGPGGRPRRQLPGRLQPSWCPPPCFPTPPYSRARMRASGVHRRWSSHPALVGGGAPSSEYGATEGAGGRSCFWGLWAVAAPTHQTLSVRCLFRG